MNLSDSDTFEVLFEAAKKIKALEDRVTNLEVYEPMVVLAKYAQITAQNFNNNVAAVINYDSQIYDPKGLVTTGASWVFTAPVAGYYWVNAHLMFDTSTGWANGEVAYLQTRINGVTNSFLDYKNDFASGGVAIYARLSGQTILKCAKGDTISFRGSQASGAALSTYTPFSSPLYNHCSIAFIAGV